jgi:hypothetical protein
MRRGAPLSWPGIVDSSVDPSWTPSWVGPVWTPSWVHYGPLVGPAWTPHARPWTLWLQPGPVGHGVIRYRTPHSRQAHETMSAFLPTCIGPLWAR